MARPVALITPSYNVDFERFSLLCDSIDRRVAGYERHYVIVSDDDMPLFQAFNSERRIVLPSSRFLPRWLRPAPRVRLRNGRKVWWSFRAPPVHGWHVQQILKIAAAMEMPEQRCCLIDSDNVFVRPFDVGAYAGGERSPLYLERAAIAPDAPLHAGWTRNCDRLLGHPPTRFPADDYIGHVIVWDKDVVRDMARAIERATQLSWPLALCRTRAFSEYLLYGHFVQNAPQRRAAHETTTESLAISHWSEEPLDAASLVAMIANAAPSKVALSVQSFSNTSAALIRQAAGLSDRARERGAPGRLHAAA
ncbi:MAG: DUF6492 family protein [Roseiarcus sp.]